MTASLAFGSYSTAWLMMSAIYVFLMDRRYQSRRIVATAIIVHILIIAFHFMVTPTRLAVMSMLVESVFAYRVLMSEFPLRKTFALLLSASVALSFFWGVDISQGCNVLCDGQEPSLYRILSGGLTIMEGVVFIGSEHFAERNNASYRSLLDLTGYNRRGDKA